MPTTTTPGKSKEAVQDDIGDALGDSPFYDDADNEIRLVEGSLTGTDLIVGSLGG